MGPVPELVCQSSSGRGQAPRRRVEAGRILGLGGQSDWRRGREPGTSQDRQSETQAAPGPLGGAQRCQGAEPGRRGRDQAQRGMGASPPSLPPSFGPGPLTRGGRFAGRAPER